MANINVGIFGATGEVGQEISNVLCNLKFPINEIFLYAGKSAGECLKTSFGEIVVQKADTADYSCLDLAFWAISGNWSKTNWKKFYADSLPEFEKVAEKISETTI